MHTLTIASMLLVAESLTVAGQRLDGCVVPSPDVNYPIQAVSHKTRDRGLREAGYSLTRDSLVSALKDSRADVRSAAAQTLVDEIGGKGLLEPIMESWQTEKDPCSAGAMNASLSELMHGLAWDTKQHPGDQQWVTPFQECSPSGRELMSVTLVQTHDQYYSGPAIRVTYRNLTAQPLAFVKTFSPMDLFSVTVLGPAGERVNVAKGRESMLEPIRSHDPPVIVVDTFRVVFWPLPQGEDASWIWRIGDDFDMSAPGTYRVSFGGRVDFLDTTMCSNILLMTVQK